MKSKATILTPREPLSFDKSEILDIRITTAASGKGEKAIRRLKYFFISDVILWFRGYFMLNILPSKQLTLLNLHVQHNSLGFAP